SRTKKSRWEENEISPSKYRSPTRYAESQSSEYRDKDALVWRKSDCNLSESQIDVFLQCTKHLPVDIALSILRDYNHNIKSAVDRCNGIELIPDLSLLEQKVLLAAVPIPCSGLGVKGKSAISAEKHVLGLLPQIRPSVIRNFYNHIGRDGCVAPRGWVPRVGHILQPSHTRLMNAGLITEDEDSPLYEKPGKRVLRSSTITPEVNTMPRKIGKGNNLAIAMVGFDQNKTGEESPERRLTRTLPVNRFARSASPQRQTNVVPIEKKPAERMSRDDLPKRKRGRPRKTPLLDSLSSYRPSSPSITAPLRSPLGPSSRPSSPSQIPSSTSSSSNGSPVQVKKREDRKLEINLNWSPIENGVRSRRPSSIMEEVDAFWIKKEKIYSNGDDSPSSSRMPGGAEGKNGWRDSSYFSSSSSGSSPDRRRTRSSSVFSSSLDSSQFQLTPPKKSRDMLRIEMVGWHQKPIRSARDSDGFVIPTLPRSPFKSPTRSRQPTPSPPDSPEI
ncbi:hypothetical protein PMAYCL1PPCAC_02892, partial [Pristionchus mayeri]